MSQVIRGKIPISKICEIQKQFLHQHRPLRSATPLQSRYLSDNLLGYSPMANNSTSINKNNKSTRENNDIPKGPIIGVDSNTVGGGVWAQTSAKRDKLAELRMALDFDKGQRSLDDAATLDEKLDLYLIDGINAVVSFSDGKSMSNTILNEENSGKFKFLPSLKNFHLYLNGYCQSSLQETSSSDSDSVEKEDRDSLGIQINIEQFDSHISELLRKVEEIKLQHIASPNNVETKDSVSKSIKSSLSPLVQLRDIMSYNQPPNTKQITPAIEKELSSSIKSNFAQCHEYFRIILLESCLKVLSSKFDVLTKISDSDLDRAATSGKDIPSCDTISVEKLHNVLNAYATGSCADRVRTLWELLDKDQDGLIDQSEMETVTNLCLTPVENAVREFVLDSVDIWPMRVDIPSSDNIDLKDVVNDELSNGKAIGWYQKWKDARIEKKSKRVFLKAMERAIKVRFDIEVETPHRLRCIYAWADKQHQGGKLASVLVDDTQYSGGRKRYVELDPKISFEEFRIEQKVHFDHLDKVGEELCTSLKEELWIHQGTGRQNQEVRREGLAFLLVVGLIDFAIISA